MKPKILTDIKIGKEKIFNKKLVNLNYEGVLVIPIKPILRLVFVFLIIFSFIFGYAIAPTAGNNSAKAAASNEEQKEALKAQLAEYEEQITKLEGNISEYQKQGKTLQSEIKRLEAKIAQMNLQIKAVNLSLLKLDQEIFSTENQIIETVKDINSNKEFLTEILRTIYDNDSKGLMEILFENAQLSDFFGNLNNLLAVQDKLITALDKIIESRDKLMGQKETLALEREDAASLKEYQESQKINLSKTQSEKNNVLKITKGKESEYQKILTETKKTAAEIRKQIFKFLGGGELDFEKAYELAKFAEKATGVRAALILAVLDRESALGKNVGQCDYKTAMHPKRDIPIFLEIIDELNLKKDLESGIIKVSCANSDGAFGGAMGPAQFIPSTWKVYKSRIAELSGNNPSSPWRNADAFLGTALYLKDAGAAGGTLAKEKEAAARYYAGSRWRNYLFTYGARVISRAQRFQEDINILGA